MAGTAPLYVLNASRGNTCTMNAKCNKFIFNSHVALIPHVTTEDESLNNRNWPDSTQTPSLRNTDVGRSNISLVLKPTLKQFCFPLKQNKSTMRIQFSPVNMLQMTNPANTLFKCRGCLTITERKDVQRDLWCPGSLFPQIGQHMWIEWSRRRIGCLPSSVRASSTSARMQLYKNFGLAAFGV